MMLRVSEVYPSIQGEGPRTGQQTIFLRFAGCNLRCPGWPCDTPHAIFPELYRDEWKTYTVEDLVEEVGRIDAGRGMNICFTGGEPFLQNDGAFRELVERLYETHTLEVFTNGTIEYPQWAYEYLYFIMDWKLPGSGEDPENKVRKINLDRLQEGDAIKFVCSDREDYDYATKLWLGYVRGTEPKLLTYAGVTWGKLENSELIAWIFEDKLPWMLNVQVHNYIWPVNERAR
jgi:7-carboxy-7-deazaguanine synthase